MKAIQVSSWGENPKFVTDAKKPENNANSPDQVQVKIISSGLHQLVRSQTAGKHYSSLSSSLPYTPGADGVGTVVQDGKEQLVYFNSLATGGGFAEFVNLPQRNLIPLPSSLFNGTPEENRKTAIQLSGLVNPGMSSWMALKTRTRAEKSGGFTVLILGVTTLSGKVAVSLARELGASKVIGVARNKSAMEALGLDLMVQLEENVPSTDYSKVFAKDAPHVDIILDYLYGAPMRHLLADALPSDPFQAKETEYVNIGGMAGVDVELPSAALRSKAVTLRGSGPGSWNYAALGKELPGLIEALVKSGVTEKLSNDLKLRKLEEVDEAFADTKGRTVFINN
eukprot:TRINITY_DN5079_c0_g1_i1.p1 TRINITY_DN5079_c0_g1~~TRINITY_DN5079_c0_g1_i1.p1  ORF type:complete len:339 (+),score=140.17 TRINITY_DN5079_c0_g1_i1:74-1090(+)